MSSNKLKLNLMINNMARHTNIIIGSKLHKGQVLNLYITCTFLRVLLMVQSVSNNETKKPLNSIQHSSKLFYLQCNATIYCICFFFVFNAFWQMHSSYWVIYNIWFNCAHSIIYLLEWGSDILVCNEYLSLLSLSKMERRTPVQSIRTS